MRFDDKVAIVTAAAGAGIGRATARRLASEGARVTVCDSAERRTKELSENMAREWGVETLGMVCDVRDPGQVDNVVRRTVNAWGRVDILVNNAGLSKLSPRGQHGR